MSWHLIMSYRLAENCILAYNQVYNRMFLIIAIFSLHFHFLSIAYDVVGKSHFSPLFLIQTRNN